MHLKHLFINFKANAFTFKVGRMHNKVYHRKIELIRYCGHRRRRISDFFKINYQPYFKRKSIIKENKIVPIEWDCDKSFYSGARFLAICIISLSNQNQFAWNAPATSRCSCWIQHSDKSKTENRVGVSSDSGRFFSPTPRTTPSSSRMLGQSRGWSWVLVVSYIWILHYLCPAAAVKNATQTSNHLI